MATGTATIEVLYFAQIAEQLGARRETLPLDAPVAAGVWLDALARRHPALGATRHLKIAVNQEYVDRAALIHPGDEVALFEPVTGG